MGLDGDPVQLADAPRGVHHGVGKGAVVGHQQQALAVLVQAAHRIQAGRDVGHQVHDGAAAQLVADGGDIPTRLIQGQVVHFLFLVDIDPLAVHVQHVPVGVHLVPDGGHMAVHLDAPFGDDLFGGAAGAQPLLAHDLLNAFQCHSFLLLVRLPALLRVSRHAPGGTHFCAQSRDRNSFWLRFPVFAARGRNPLAKSRPLPLLRFGCFVRWTRLSFAVPGILLGTKFVAEPCTRLRLAHSRRQISLSVSQPSAHVGWLGRRLRI